MATAKDINRGDNFSNIGMIKTDMQVSELVRNGAPFSQRNSANTTQPSLHSKTLNSDIFLPKPSLETHKNQEVKRQPSQVHYSFLASADNVRQPQHQLPVTIS